MSSKQDRTYPRTAAELERKYNFGRNFSEILGIAKDAQTHAYNAEESVKEWSQRIVGLEGNYAEIKAEQDRISLLVQGFEGDYSEIIQTQESITAKVGELEGNYSKITQSVDGISAEVVSLDGEFSEMKQTVNGISTRVGTLDGKHSTLTQTVGGISANVTQLNDDLTGVTAELALKVGKDANGNLIGQIHIGADQLTIDTDNFKLTADGTAIANTGIFNNSSINHCDINYGYLGDFAIVENGLECVVGKGNVEDIDGWKYETISSVRVLSGRIETSYRKNRYDYDDIGLAEPVLVSERSTALYSGYMHFKVPSSAPSGFTIMYVERGTALYEICLNTTNNTLEVKTTELGGNVIV